MPPSDHPPTVHIVGAGVAGLSCAVALVRVGRRVAIHEATPDAGGRLSELAPPVLLSSHWSALSYLEEIEANPEIRRQRSASYRFIELPQGPAWQLSAGRSYLPLWLLNPHRRVPGTGLSAYLAALRLSQSNAGTTVAEALAGPDAAGRRLWTPACRLLLNAPPERASATLFWSVLRNTWLKGARFCQAVAARNSVYDCFIAPALAKLHERRAEMNFACGRLDLEVSGERVTALRSADGTRLPIRPQDWVVLAVPADEAARLLPGLSVPVGGEAMIAVRFALDFDVPREEPLLLLVGGLADRLHLASRHVELVAHAAEQLLTLSDEELATRLWEDARQALGLDPDTRPSGWTLARWPSATPPQDPASLARRPPTRTELSNLLLAGDYVETHLPGGIDGAVAAGQAAAWAVLGGDPASVLKRL